MITLQKTAITFTAATQNMQFDEPFNQCTFFNYDTTTTVVINKLSLPPAIAIGTGIYPTSFTVSLNEGEVNTTNYNIDLQQSLQPNLQIVYSQYKDIGEL